MKEKYETELQLLFNACDQNWEAVARVLFQFHPDVVKEREERLQSMKRSFSHRKNKKVGTVHGQTG